MIRAFLVKQLGHASGFFDRLLVKLLNKSNASMNDFTSKQLDLSTSDAVLKIGFGDGYLLEKMTIDRFVSRIVGIDPQLEVVEVGKQKSKTAIAHKNIELQHTSGKSLSYGENTFAKVYTTNTVYFWLNPQAALAECRRVSQPRGKLITCYDYPEFLELTKLIQHDSKYLQHQELKSLMMNVDFVDFATATVNGCTGDGFFYCTLGLVKKYVNLIFKQILQAYEHLTKIVVSMPNIVFRFALLD